MAKSEKKEAVAAQVIPDGEEFVSIEGDGKCRGTTQFVETALIKVVATIQPRKTVGDLGELQRNIKQAKGITQPLLLRPAKNGKGYEVICGSRRLACAKALGLKVVPALVRDDEEVMDDTTALGIAVAENSGDTRTDLRPLEKAAVFQKMQKADPKASAQDIGRRCGCSGQTVREALSVLELPKAVQTLVESGSLSMRAATALAKFDEATVKKALPQIEAGDSERTIKSLCNEVVKGDNPAAEKSKRKRGGKKGNATVVVWRSRREIKDMLEGVVAERLSVLAEGKKPSLFNEGVLAALLFISGDIEALEESVIKSAEFMKGVGRVEALVPDEVEEEEEEEVDDGETQIDEEEEEEVDEDDEA